MARRRKQVVDELTETVKQDMKMLKVYERKKAEYEEEMKNVHIYDKIDKSHIHVSDRQKDFSHNLHGILECFTEAQLSNPGT